MNFITQRIFCSLARPSKCAFATATILNNHLGHQNILLPMRIQNLHLNQIRFSFSTQPNLENDQDVVEAEPNSDANLERYIKNSKTLQTLRKKGIKGLFQIQIDTFQAIYEGSDILASDRTGSGKTIAYTLPILEKFREKNIFNTRNKNVKFLILCPTRELTLQVQKEVASLKNSKDDFQVTSIYGGVSIGDQMQKLRKGVDIIVGTPGRITDLLVRGILNFNELEVTCIDQADRMLEIGFKSEIEEIYNRIQNQSQRKTQNLLFSATMPEWVNQISNKYLAKSKKIIKLISKQQTQTSTTVQHLAVHCAEKNRIRCIQAMIKTYNPHKQQSTIIFAQTKRGAANIAQEITNNTTIFLHGDMSQREREYSLNEFRSGRKTILVATDVASRGLDINNVGLIIQLQPPQKIESFIHRTGRTGRAGKKGISVTLFDQNNLQKLRRIQKEANVVFKGITQSIFGESEQNWLKKINKIPQTLQRVSTSALNNEKIDNLANLLTSNYKDSKQLIKKLLIALAGAPPTICSITTNEEGYKSFLILSKQTEANKQLILFDFLKQNFADFQIVNVHAQSQNIIFDVPKENLSSFEIALNKLTESQSAFEIKQAICTDLQMKPLDQFLKQFRQNRQNTTSQNDFSKQLNSRTYAQSQENLLKVFVSGLPFDVTQQDIKNQLDEMRVELTEIILKKKSEENVFAFISVADKESLNTLKRRGLVINGKKIRAREYTS